MKPQKFKDHLLHRIKMEDIADDFYINLIVAAIAEDLAGSGLWKGLRPSDISDPTTQLLAAGSGIAGSGIAGVKATTALVARQDCVVCGIEIAMATLECFAGTGFGNGPLWKPEKRNVKPPFTSEFFVGDGGHVVAGETIAIIKGDAALLLVAERIMLNFLQKLSGIATLTAAYVERLGDTGVRLLDTRKTTPGWRVLEKYAVATGGGWNHRIGLFDRVMLKDNHLAAGGATAGERLAALIRRAREKFPKLAVECEVDNRDQIAPVLDAGADVILLDNFPLSELRPALEQIGDRAWTEVSGGVTLDSIADIAALRPDFISTGAITHHATWVDIGLDWQM